MTATALGQKCITPLSKTKDMNRSGLLKQPSLHVGLWWETADAGGDLTETIARTVCLAEETSSNLKILIHGNGFY